MSLALDDLPRDPEWLLRSCSRWRKSLLPSAPGYRPRGRARDCSGGAGCRRAERDVAQAEIEKLRLLDPAAAARAVRPALGAPRPRSAAARPGRPRADRSSSRGGAGERLRGAAPLGAPARRRNLGALPAHLPRVEVLVDVEDKSCPCCGGALHVIGEDTSEMLDIVPAQLRVKVIRRPRYGCRACEGAVVQAPAPERPITGGMATEALLAHVLVAKYADFLPLYRQAADLRPARDRARPLDLVRLGWAGLLVAGAAVAPAAPARHELDPDLRR